MRISAMLLVLVSAALASSCRPKPRPEACFYHVAWDARPWGTSQLKCLDLVVADCEENDDCAHATDVFVDMAEASENPAQDFGGSAEMQAQIDAQSARMAPRLFNDCHEGQNDRRGTGSETRGRCTSVHPCSAGDLGMHVGLAADPAC